MYTALTSDVVARCGFGTKLNSLHDPENIFVKQTKNFALEDVDMNFFLTLIRKSEMQLAKFLPHIMIICRVAKDLYVWEFVDVFPFLARLTPFFPPGTLEFFAGILKNVMQSRRENNIKIPDFIDSLNEMMEKLDTEEYKKLGIDEITVMCQALIFFIAGSTTQLLFFRSFSLVDIYRQFIVM